jgi:4-amino-4-deoxy-L-arabinose transferase-like glycosyltransferase
VPHAGVRRDLIGLLLLATLLFLPGLGARDLWNPSEPAYGRAVVEMAESGEWLIPTVNGERFLEKPPLYFWLARAAGLAGGVNEFTLRLPALLSAIVATLFVYLLGRREAGPFAGRAAAALFLTFFSIAAAARQIQMDLPATACVAALVYVGIPSLKRPRALGPWALLGLIAGVGFLFRGPVTWIYAAFPLVGAWALDRERLLPSPRSAAVAVLALAGALAAWVGPLGVAGELGVLRESLLRQAFSRFVDSWDHVQPWWYYLKYVWIDLAPWSLLLPLALLGRAEDPKRRRFENVCWIWLIGTIVFFSFSASKRSAYLMPAAPAAALLIAGVVERLFDGTLGRASRRYAAALHLGLASTLVVAGCVAFGARGRYPGEARVFTVAAVALIAAGLACALVFALHRSRAWTVAWAAVAVLQAFVGAVVLPQANPYKSARRFAAAVSGVAAGDSISGYRLWRWRADYSYYLGRSIGRVRSPGDLAELWAADERHCLIVEQWKRDEVLGVIGAHPPDARATVGSKEVDLYCNHSRKSNFE